MSGRIIVELGQMTVTPRIMRLRCFVGIPCQLPDAAQPLIEEPKDRLADRKNVILIAKPYDTNELPDLINSMMLREPKTD